MTVFHVIISLRVVGGAEMMLKRLIEHSKSEKKIFNVVITLLDSGDIGDYLRALGVTVIDLNMKSAKGLVFALPKLIFLIKKHNPNIIQTWMYHSDLFAGLVGKVCGVRKIVWNIRNTAIPPSRFWGTKLLVNICALLSKYIPNSIVCNSSAGLQAHVKLGYPLSKMIVIPNGFDQDEWKKPKIKDKDLLNPLTKNSIIIGTIGRFDTLKGFDIFIEAAGIVSSRSKRSYVFMMAGREIDNNNNQLKELIVKRGGNANFELLGERTDIPRIMQMIDVFCLPSRAEGFPNVLAEAMLAEKVCVSTDVGDAKKILGNNGIIVPAENPLLLASGLLKAEKMSKKSVAERGKSSRERIIKHFSMKRISAMYLNLYKQLLANGK